jgi:hypothetical protein
MAKTSRKRGDSVPRRRRAPETFIPVSRRQGTRRFVGFDEFGAAMYVDDMGLVWNIAPSTVRRRMRLGLLPPPFSKYPLQWKTAEVRAFWEAQGGRDTTTRRRRVAVR